MRVLLLDNYDSFTYNLEYILKKYSKVEVARNDKITAQECQAFDSIVLSPGPGLPQQAGNMSQIISSCAGKIPILGVCLGHQALGEYLGAKLKNLNGVFHGKKSEIQTNENKSVLFENLQNKFFVGRYHSWVIDPESLSNKITVTAVSNEGHIMAIQNIDLKLYGVQFHPESILTEDGDEIISNFLKLANNS